MAGEQPEATMTDIEKADDDYGDLGERRNRRIRMIAWVTIISLILVGGGSTVISLLIG